MLLMCSQELEREGLLTQRLRRSNSSLSRHCVLCVDFLGSGLSSSEFTLKLNELLPNSLVSGLLRMSRASKSLFPVKKVIAIHFMLSRYLANEHAY